MGEKLTRSDVKKIEQEIEHRRLVVRKEALEARTLNITRRKRIRMQMRAESVIWSVC